MDTTAQSKGTNIDLESDAAFVTTYTPQPAFVETRTGERIQSALAWAKSEGDIVCIYGGPGVGKTCAATDFVRKFPGHVWLATMSPSRSTVVPALEELAEAVGLRDPSGGARRISQMIRRRLRGSVAAERGLHGLIIIDEAQHLTTKAVEEIRSLHDATGVGIALIGNESVYARITGGGRLATFAQLYSRMGLRIALDRPSSEDIRALVKKRWNADDAELLEVLEGVAAQPGALRLVTKIMTLLAAKRTLTAKAARRACNVLGVEEV